MLDIDFITMESEMNVCDSIYNILDKIDYMMEYNASDEYIDDLVMEAFEIYLEATQRRKKADEIDQYIRDKKLGDINSDNPSKSKSARNIRNFLLQHNFDPKTETIDSDIPGKRIKFNISRGKDSSRASFNPIKNSINTGVDKFNHQANVQQSFAHEKGHHVFANTTPSGAPLPFKRDQYNPEKLELDKNKQPIPDKNKSQSRVWQRREDKNDRGIKMLDEAEEQGKDINSHDNGRYLTGGSQKSPEELEADLHSAKTTRIRTKYAGRKRAVKRSGATRNVNDNEIMKRFETIARSGQRRKLNDEKMDEIRIHGINDKQLRILKNFMKIKDVHNVIKDKKTSQLFYENIKELKSVVTSVMDSSIHKSVPENFYEELDERVENIRLLQEKVNQLKDMINDFYKDAHSKDFLTRELSSMDYDDDDIGYKNFVKRLQDATKQLGRYKIRYSTLIHDARSYDIKLDESLIRNLNDLYISIARLSHSKTSVNEFNKNLDEIDVNVHKLQKQLGGIIRLDEIVDQLKKIDREYDTEWLEIVKNFKMDDSTQLRHDFVKKYVHEFFEDYYSLENFEIYLEG